MNSNDWKTTLAGVLTGAAVILTETYQTLIGGKPANWGLVAMGIGIMALGKLAAGITPKQSTLQDKE